MLRQRNPVRNADRVKVAITGTTIEKLSDGARKITNVRIVFRARFRGELGLVARKLAEKGRGKIKRLFPSPPKRNNMIKSRKERNFPRVISNR